MKKLLISILLMGIYLPCHAAFGIGTLTDIAKKILGKTENVYNTTENIQSQSKEIHAGITDLVKVTADIKAQVGDISAKVNAQGVAIAGVGNRVDQRNVEMRDDNSKHTSTATNEKDLLMYIFGGMFGFMTFLCGRLVLTIRQMNKQIFQLIERNVKKEEFILGMIKDELKDGNEKRG